MDFVDQINLDPLPVLIAAVVWIYCVKNGKPLILLGVFLSMALWTRTVLIGPFVHTWFWLAGVLGGTLVYLHQNRLFPKLPTRDRWIVAWIALWWIWIILLIALYDGIDKRAFLRQMLLYVVLPLPVIIVAFRDLGSLRGFALGFMLTSLLGGWYAMAIIGVTTSDLMSDPLLRNLNIRQLGLASYHYFARGYAISLFFAVTFFLESRRLLARVGLALAAAICIYLIFMSGSRQSLNSALLSLGIYCVWSLAHRQAPRLQMSLLTGAAVVLGVWIYLAAPSLIVRDGESSIVDSFDLVSDRGGLWAIGWQNFLSSPVWGTGFRFSVLTHNILIGTLADQGVVGMVFFISMIIFALRRGAEAWRSDGSTPSSTWGIALMCILVFAISHSMASGTVISVPYLYWPAAFLWVMREPPALADPERALRIRRAPRPHRLPTPPEATP